MISDNKQGVRGQKPVSQKIDQREKGKTFDRLKLVKELPDGAYYDGEKGRYFIRSERSKGNRIGTVVLNRKYMTGCFKAKHSRERLLFLGDYEELMLSFYEAGPGEIVIRSKPKKRHDKH